MPYLSWISWALPTGQVSTNIIPLEGPADNDYSLGWSFPNRRFIKSKSHECYCIWNGTNGRLIYDKFTYHVRNDAMSDNCKHFLIQQYDDTLATFDVEQGWKKVEFGKSGSAAEIISNDGKIAILAGKDAIEVWKTHSRRRYIIPHWSELPLVE